MTIKLTKFVGVKRVLNQDVLKKQTWIVYDYYNYSQENTTYYDIMYHECSAIPF